MAPLPNIEIISVLVMLFAIALGKYVGYTLSVFVLLEGLVFGFGLWWFSYLYIWAVPALAGVALRKMDSPLGWAMVSGVYGLAFGALCGIVDLFIGGWAYALTKWASGIPFDVLHCAGNFGIALILFKPLWGVLEKLHNRMK